MNYKFIQESNKIESILRPPTEEEVAEFTRFLALPHMTVEDLEEFVSVYQPNASLRDRFGLDVRVGRYTPPAGGPQVKERLEWILEQTDVTQPYHIHCLYEGLHPFTDGNGRSGRALWAWQMGPGNYPLGFLHTFYYQALSVT